MSLYMWERKRVCRTCKHHAKKRDGSYVCVYMAVQCVDADTVPITLCQRACRDWKRIPEDSWRTDPGSI